MTAPAVIDPVRPRLTDHGPRGTPSALIADVATDSRQVTTTVNLAAFENVMSDTAREMVAGPLADRYLIGQEHERQGRQPALRAGLLSAGYPAVDRLEQAATETLGSLLGASWIDFRPLSGLHATMCAVALLTEPGDLVYSIAPESGGHFATHPLLESLGRRAAHLPWDPDTGTVDLTAFARKWRADPGAMVFLDHGVPLAPLPTREIRDIMGTHALLVYDASHTLGLIVGEAFQDPLGEGCDVVQGNTHKSFPGAHKGVIAFADADIGRGFSQRLGNALVSSQQTGATLANYVTTLELGAHATAYARQMLRNQADLAEALEHVGFRLYSPQRQEGAPPSRSHVLLVDRWRGRRGYDLATDLVRAGLVLNARPVHGETRLRLGVQEVTRRGMRKAEMWRIAELLAEAAQGAGTRGAPASTAAHVTSLSQEFDRVRYSFDTQESES